MTPRYGNGRRDHTRLIVAALLWLCVGEKVSALEKSPPAWAAPPAPNPANFAQVFDAVKDFSARGDGKTDDWEAIQKAEGMTASGLCSYTQPTLVVIPPTRANNYVISQAIRLCSNVTLWVKSIATTITFANSMKGTDVDYTSATHVNSWPFTGAILGGFVVANSTLPTYSISDALAAGATHITLTKPSDVNLLRPGDLVDIETTSKFSPAGTQPTDLKMALIAAVDPKSAVVTFDRPMDFSSPSVQLRKLSNLAGSAGWPAINGNSHVPIFAVHHCGVYGGRWVAAGAQTWAQAFNDGGGMLDCSIAPNEVIAADGIGWGNLMQDSFFAVQHEVISHAPLEMAFHSSNTTVDIGTIELLMAVPDAMPAGWIVAVDEGSHGNRISIKHIELQGAAAETLRIVGTSGGAEIVHASVISPKIKGGAPIVVSYTTRAGDRPAQIAAGLAAAFGENTTFAGAGLSVVANPLEHLGIVLVRGVSGKLPFFMQGSKTNGVVVYSPSNDIVRITNGYGNRVRIESVQGGFISGALVEIADVTSTGATPPTSGNEVVVGQSVVTTQLNCVVVRGAHASGNVVLNGASGTAALANSAPCRGVRF